MITLELSLDDVLRSRFAISPLGETIEAAHAMANPPRGGWRHPLGSRPDADAAAGGEGARSASAVCVPAVLLVRARLLDAAAPLAAQRHRGGTRRGAGDSGRARPGRNRALPEQAR